MANVGSGATGQTLIGAGNGASPTFKSIGSDSGLTVHGVVISEGAGAFVSVGGGTTGQLLTAVTGSDPIWSAPATSGTVTSVSVVTANGFAGTVATATSTPAITLTTTATGVLSGNGTTISGSAVTQHATLVGGASNAVTSVLQGAGQLLIGTTASDPSAASLTPGTGIAITSSSGSITINAVGGGFTWTVVTGTTQAAAVNSGYIANNAGLVTVTLPATSAVGDMVAVTGINNATGWKVAQNAGNQIFYGASSTMGGTGGSLASTATRDVVYLLCVTANANWQVVNAIGNLTVV